MIDPPDHSKEKLQNDNVHEVLAIDADTFSLLCDLRDSKQVLSGRFPDELYRLEDGLEGPKPETNVLVMPYYNIRNDPYGLGTWGIQIDNGNVINARIVTVPNAEGVSYEVTIKNDKLFRNASPEEARQILNLLDFISQQASNPHEPL